MRKLFVTGIGTDVGKTLVSAVLCQALEADYWKPVQAGSLENTDSDTIRKLVNNSKTQVHTETYRLRMPLSPHAAAAEEGLTIEREKFVCPDTEHDLVIEGAGGAMVPLAEGFLMMDLIQDLKCEVVVVSRNYLGSINHTLLTCEALARRRIPVLGIVFNGVTTPASEGYIREYCELPMLGRIDEESEISSQVVNAYAARFKQALTFLRRRGGIS